MILLNFSHPLNPEQLAQLEALPGKPSSGASRSWRNSTTLALCRASRRAGRPRRPQRRRMADAAHRGCAAVVQFRRATLLAHLHGRMGYFPAIVRLRPIAGATPPRFEVAEIINLQDVREAARVKRS
jgi:hypothetical protein